MRLTVIIVNYKTPHLVNDCIRSIFEYDRSGLEVLVVDNNSEDNSKTIINNAFPEVEFLQAGYNAGFARANNLGIIKAKGNIILLMNSDTINLNNAVNECEKQLTNSDYVAAGVQLLNKDLTPQISGSYVMKGGLNFLLPLPYLGRLLRSIALLLRFKKPSVKSAASVQAVDWINGAFLMVKKSAIKTAGLLDEEFFLYAEEAEWCSRLKMQGRLCIFGGLNVLHLQGESANAAFDSEGKGYFNLFDIKGRQIMISTFLRIRKEFGLLWFFVHLSVYFLTIPVFFICLIIASIISLGKPSYNFKQFIGFVKNFFHLLSLSVKMISNRPHFYKVI